MLLSEEQVLILLKDPANKGKGFTILMDTWKEQIYWHIRRLVVSHEDAEDVLQETFIKAYLYAGSFNGDSRIYTWLYRIATNECIRLFRKRQKKEFKKTVLTEKLSAEFVTEDIESGDDILAKFQLAVLQLPEKQRVVFNLRYYDGMNYEEISQVLNTSVNSLKTSYHYAYEKLKDFMINR
jgi:RNA polymerase sigma-70 factor, ECF subfamily